MSFRRKRRRSSNHRVPTETKMEVSESTVDESNRVFCILVSSFAGTESEKVAYAIKVVKKEVAKKYNTKDIIITEVEIMHSEFAFVRYRINAMDLKLT